MPEVAPARQALEEIARTMRGAIGSLRAAAETLEKFPALEPARQARLLAVVAQESERLGELVCSMEQVAQLARPPGGEEAGTATRVGELLDRLAAVAGELGFEVAADAAVEPDLRATALDLPGAATLAAAAAFLAELRREMAVTRLRLAAQRVERHLLLDLGWHPEAVDLHRLLDWQGPALDAPPAGGGPGEPRGLRRLARDHDGEAWFILDRNGAAAHVKVLLPLAPAAGEVRG